MSGTGGGTTSGTGGGTTSGTGGGTTSGTGGGATSGTGGGTTSGTGGGTGGSAVYDIPNGTLLFSESFEDTSFNARGWYDGAAAPTLSTDVPTGGGTRSYEARFAMGATNAPTPARHQFTGSERVFIRMWLKFSPNWVGSGVAYHPHMFHLTTNKDGMYIGPANSHMTTYLEVVGLRPMLALQDARNVDTACILRNNDTFVGCNGNFSTYVFTENRSVAACNGLRGDVDGRDCFDNGGGNWYSARYWRTPSDWFSNTAGPRYKADWHRFEAYYQMNTIQNGVGQTDGKLRLWIDGEKVLSYDRILFRTNENADMVFNQFLMLPYIGPGSPVAQSYFVDELRVATGLIP